jgi:hypothetical protein
MLCILFIKKSLISNFNLHTDLTITLHLLCVALKNDFTGYYMIRVHI